MIWTYELILMLESERTRVMLLEIDSGSLKCGKICTYVLIWLAVSQC